MCTQAKIVRFQTIMFRIVMFQASMFQSIMFPTIVYPTIPCAYVFTLGEVSEAPEMWTHRTHMHTTHYLSNQHVSNNYLISPYFAPMLNLKSIHQLHHLLLFCSWYFLWPIAKLTVGILPSRWLTPIALFRMRGSVAENGAWLKRCQTYVIAWQKAWVKICGRVAKTWVKICGKRG